MIRRIKIAEPISYTCTACIRGVAMVTYEFGKPNNPIIISLCDDCDTRLQSEINEG